MSENGTSTGLDEVRRLFEIENHRAWTARAFCMATAELRSSFEPEPLTPVRRRSGFQRVAWLRRRKA